MVKRNRESGLVLLEAIIAWFVFVVLMGWAFTSGSNQLRHVAASFDQTQATQLASGRLEGLRPEGVSIEIGVSEFEIPVVATEGLADVRGEQHVRQLEPGLIEVQVTVSWRAQELTQRREVVLTTLIERRRGR